MDEEVRRDYTPVRRFYALIGFITLIAVVATGFLATAELIGNVFAH